MMQKFLLVLALFTFSTPTFANSLSMPADQPQPAVDESGAPTDEETAQLEAISPSPSLGKGWVCVAKDRWGRMYYGRAIHPLRARAMASNMCQRSHPGVAASCRLVYCQPRYAWVND